RVTLVMTLPDVPTPTAIPGAAASPAPAPLAAAELKAFQDTLDQWDAFLVFSIKQLGDAVGDKQFRDQLLQILLDSRYRLVQALNNPPANAELDPVRALFLDEWRQLHDAVRAAARRGMLGARALEFMSFISAGDALFALDQAAPALGMRISAADLRRLAHIMAPHAPGDPLQFNYREDRDLKKLFAVPEPPASRHPIEEEDVPPSAPGASPSSGAATTPAAHASPDRSTPLPSPGPGASRRASRQTARPSPLLLRMLSILSPPEAAAAQEEKDDEPAILPRLRDVADRLYRLVVTEDNAQTYRRDMGLLLDLSAERQLGEGAVDADNGTTYVTLVRSAAWQESCWRQFVMARAGIRWLESATGDIGVMQVNKHIWRGHRDSCAHDALCFRAAEVRSRACRRPSRAVGVRGLQRRSGRVQSMASAGAACAQTNRFQLLGQVPRSPGWNPDRHPQLRPHLGPPLCQLRCFFGEDMKKSSVRGFVLTIAGVAFAAGVALAADTGAPAYRLAATIRVGGDGGWDYATLSSDGQLLYVTRTTHTMALDVSTRKTVADIGGQQRSHGVALVQDAGRGFISDGKGASVLIFDLKTFATIGKVAAADDADSIIYDPASDRVLVFCGGAHQMVAIAPDVNPAGGKAAATVDLGGSPEFAVADGNGKVYVNIADKDEVAV